MRSSPLRKRLAREAARLLYSQETDQLFRARQEAQRRLAARDASAAHLPSREEIAAELQELAARFPLEKLDDVVVTRLTMLRMMRLLARYRPRWEQTLSEVDANDNEPQLQQIHLCSCLQDELETLLAEEGLECACDAVGERCEIPALGLQLRLHPFDSWETARHYPGAMCWTISDLERQLASDLPAVDLYSHVGMALHRRDRFAVYRALLLPLEQVEQSPAWHPEGDALYHSLQVYQLAREERPYDEELLLAALLHDVGKGIDPLDPVTSALEALADFITPRTAWLIENHRAGLQVLDGSIGQRAQRRLHESEDFDELMILARADRNGRRQGAQVDDLDEVLQQLRDLAQENG